MDDNGTLSVSDKQLHKGTITNKEIGGVITEVTGYQNVSNEKIVFHNTYKPNATYIKIVGNKILDGRTLANNEFELLDASGVKVESVKNDENGTIEFADILVEEVGEYIYTVR